MEEYFFSDTNISSQTKKLILHLELEEQQINREVVLKCKKIIINYMKITYDKYGTKRPYNISKSDYLEKLNKKSLNDCLKTIYNKKEQTPLPPAIKKPSKQYAQTNPYSQTNKNSYMRPDEIIENLKNPINPQQLQHPQQQNNPSKEYQGFTDAGGFASFSSVDTPSGPFITATGEYGMPLELQGENTFKNDGKKNFSDEIEKKMGEMQGRYMGGQMGPPQSTPDYYGVPPQGSQPVITDLTAKLLNLNNNDAQVPLNYKNEQQEQSNQQSNQQQQINNLMMQIGQMQQSGKVNPQALQLMMQQLSNLNKNVQQPPSQQPNNPNSFDYSFSSLQEDFGNDFNQAYNDLKNPVNTNYSGIDSFDNNYKPLVKNTSADDGDLNKRLEMLKNERENVNKTLNTNPGNTKFDPTKSPNQNNHENNHNDFFF